MPQGQFTAADIGKFRPEDIDETGANISESAGSADYIGAAKDLAIGAAKRVPATVLNVMSWLESLTSNNPEAQAGYEKAKQSVAASNPTQQLGGFYGDVALAAAPGSLVTKGGQLAAEAVPAFRGAALARPLVRGAVEAAGGAGIAGAQGGDPTTGAVMGGTLGTVFGAGRQTANAAKGAMANPNPVEREALEYVQSQGVPVDAGTMSGNLAARGILYGADRTIPGSVVATKASQKEADALRNLSGRLADKAHPTPQTPETAGRDLGSTIDGVIKAKDAAADTHYAAVRAMAPANTQAVVVGHKPSPSGLVKSVPVIENVAFPVETKAIKQSLKPVVDDMERNLPETQRAANPALNTLRNIMNMPDHVSALDLDRDLSRLKSIVREADLPQTRNLNQGIAAKAVREIGGAIDAAVAKGGPRATAALAAGRQATREKYLAEAIWKKLKDEPVQAFQQGTARKDTGIDYLRELQKLAPNDIPKLGRAFLDDLFTTAQAGGKMEGAQGMASKWANLGAETKKMLYGTPLTEELDKFFLATKRLAQNPNPSNSAGVAMSNLSAASVLSLLTPTNIWTDLAGLGVSQGGGYAISTLMRNPKAVRLLTQGLTAQPGSQTAQYVKRSLAALIKQGAMRTATGQGPLTAKESF